MPNQQMLSLVMARAAGKSAGVSPQNLGRLSIVSYMLANPVLAMVAARSMAPKTDVKLVPDGTGKPEPTSTAEDIKAAAASAAAALLSKTQAETAKANAESAAIRAESAALRAENAAPPAPTK